MRQDIKKKLGILYYGANIKKELETLYYGADIKKKLGYYIMELHRQKMLP